MIYSGEQHNGSTADKVPTNFLLRLLGTAVMSAGVLLPVTACGTGNEKPPKTSEIVTTYLGRDLVCRAYVVEDTVPDPSLGYDCDFPGFHADPDYKAPSGMQRADDGVFKEHEVPYKGDTLHCLVYSVTKKDQPAMTCDFTRFYAELPR